MSNFSFMAEWPELQGPAGKAQALVRAASRAASTGLRMGLF